MLAVADSMTSPNWHIALDGRACKMVFAHELANTKLMHTCQPLALPIKQPALYIVVQTAQGATCANAHNVDGILPQMASCRCSACHAFFWHSRLPLNHLYSSWCTGQQTAVRMRLRCSNHNSTQFFAHLCVGARVQCNSCTCKHARSVFCAVT